MSLRILNESTAAALAYGLGRDTSGENSRHDLGAAVPSDISILEIHDGVFEVSPLPGDTFLWR